MSKYQSYSTQKRKLQTISEKAEKQKSDISQLPNKTVIFNTEHFGKVIHTFKLITNELENWRGSFTLVNFPEWAIPMIRPIVFYTVPGNGFNAENADFSGGGEISLNYWFNKTGIDTYIFQFQTSIDADFPTDFMANVHLYLMNNRDYENIHKAKT